MMKKWLVTAAALLLVSCGGDKQPSEDEKTFTEGVDKTVEDVTGITTIKVGKRTQDKLKAINDDYNKKMQEVLEENE
ncbi:MAG: hypothetical protein RRC34_05825 [Lentisphaeria bacterium]|nr:hypothetical protein [Lentisphaeria bacterium]